MKLAKLTAARPKQAEINEVSDISLAVRPEAAKRGR